MKLHLLFYHFWSFVYDLFYYVMIYMAYVSFLKIGAGSRNRTGITSLEDWHSTIELYPQMAVREGFEPSVVF